MEDEIATEDNYVVVYSNGVYTSQGAVAEVNGVQYASVAAAISAASAGNTITFIADINEDVTINKNLTIEGAEKNYTGTMTVNNVTATLENINFVKGQVYKNKNTGTTAKVTIKNCDFDGQGLNAYAVNLGGTNNIVIENVTAKDYGYGLLQVPSSCAGLTVKDVNISSCNYGLKVDYANSVSLENVTMSSVNIGIYDSNHGDKTYTIKNCEISSIAIWERPAAKTTTFKFEGVNNVNELTTSPYAKFYGTQAGTKVYETLSSAVAAAEAGQTVELLGNETGSGLKINKNVAIDFGGNTYTINSPVGSTNTESQGFQLLKGNNVTIKNGTVDVVPGTHVVWMFNAYANLTLEGVTVNCKNMVRADDSRVLVVNNGGSATPRVNYSNVTIENPLDVAAIWLDPRTELVANAGLEDEIATEDNYAVVYSNGVYTSQGAVAQVGDNRYASLQAAYDAATVDEPIILLNDVTGPGLVINKDITIDFGGFTYTANKGVGSTGTETLGFQILNGNTVKLQNGTFKAGEGILMLINNYTDLTVKDMTLDGTSNIVQYVLSNNSGTVNISGNTNITANENGVAFDVCKYANYAVPTVNVNTTGTITGKIEVSESINSNLNISKGTFTTPIQEEWCAEGFSSLNAAENVWMVKPVQTIELKKDWNWVSQYVIGTDYETVFDQLQTKIGANGIEIKAQVGMLRYEDGEWNGSLESTTPSEMYKINVNDDKIIKIVGDIVNPEDYAITLAYNANNAYNWNYIGLPMDRTISVADAFAGVVNSKDIVKSQDQFAQYFNGQWWGSLKNLEPGVGYMYERKVEGATFKFTYPTQTRGAVEANITTENNHWVPAGQYANNMSMVATLGANSENYELAAFVNGEVRGSARPIYVDVLDTYMFFLTINGNDIEEVTFKCYDINTNTEYTLGERINYSNNAILGSVEEPVVLRGTLGMGEVSANAVAIYPNPATTSNDINLATTCDKVEVFNALGVKVAEYQNVDTIDALETAGVYVIRVTNNGNTQNCRLVVK